ncbi:hypothetical protein PC9H_000274 [Pleurotus ostreatus]|uniref:Uncharacterized protein n=1 Tax=Pleurotus ostreatus TaxID=5322 RepID=A0A8H7A4F6_PLEOS|nr:uncharacterized protein PC9H_000274 [Pleurotus ostreatus]KAF7439937.1 hypothetical protein PC9H_000274 [Pleurotus ostreatus]KAJ8700862.1 hypothetical protein PTI98_003845 [Pleurotus ostreatus]
MKVISKLIPLLAAALHVSAYGVITDVSGANGLHGVGFGVVSTITTLDQFRQQSSIINDIEIAGGLTGICGRTLGGGVIDVQAMLAGIASTGGLPTAFPGGFVKMKLFQPDTGGIGPYTCEVSPSATGEDFAGMAIRMDILRRFDPTTTTFSLIAQIPNGVTCTGGPNANACLVRCRNAVIAGSFGGCVAVTTADSGGATGAAAETDVVFDANDAPNAMVPPSVPIAVPSTFVPVAAPPLASAPPLGTRPPAPAPAPFAARPPGGAAPSLGAAGLSLGAAGPSFGAAGPSSGAARPPLGAAGPSSGAARPPLGGARPPAGGRPLAPAATRPTTVGALPPGSRSRPGFSRRRHSRQ